MDFLLDNGFFIILCIVVFVVRLFLQANKHKKETPPQVSAEDEENRRDYADTRGSSDYLKEYIKKSRPVPERKTVPVQSQAADFQPHWLEPEETPRPVRKASKKQPPEAVFRTALPSAEPLAPLETPKPAPPSPAKETSASGFPGNLAHLSPLKRAVALAEILGSPKGFT
jgi:hypothetical protein